MKAQPVRKVVIMTIVRGRREEPPHLEGVMSRGDAVA